MISPLLFFSVPNKCASQYMNQFAFHLLGLTESDIKRGSSMYSYRSAVRAKQSHFSDNQIQTMCKKGEKVLFVRHPLLRLISAWDSVLNII